MLSDMGRIIGRILLLCLIGLTNANPGNRAPTINTVLYQVCEDLSIGQVAFTIDVSNPENAPLKFSLTGPNAFYFNIGQETGIATIKIPLESDVDVAAPLAIGVVINYGETDPVTGNINVIILNANDNAPIFTAPSYDYKIPENTAVGSSLFTVTAADGDKNGMSGVVSYSIDEVTPTSGQGLFSIDRHTGVVKLAGILNYTVSTYYQLKINATDGGGNCASPTINYHSSIAFSFITVVDIPDMDPQFINLPYIGKVAENSPLGTTVLKVIALDQDKGVGDKIIYTIEDSTPEGLFTISSDGVITVMSKLDREHIGDVVILTVKAKESQLNVHGQEASVTTNVQINIDDVNDNAPEFYKCADSGDVVSCEKATHFTGEVNEHSLGSIFINMTVDDSDKNSQTKLTLEGADKDVFSVEPPFVSSKSIVQLQVKKPQKLDFEKVKQMVLMVVATDQEETNFHNTATVTINIKDTNDNSPVFPKNTYKLDVPEHSKVNTSVATITAEDPDTMDKDNITYRLLPDSILTFFNVNPHTGEIYVTNATLLDREVRSLFSATLQATDSDGKPGTTVLEITLTDINDQAPVMNRDSYIVFVKEGEKFELKIEATDRDDPNTPNSQITYSIVPPSSNFTIDPNTGVLTNSGELDREALDPKLNGEIELNVTATDKGDPPLSSTVTVIINVQDVNDNTPHFTRPSYKFFVKEGLKGAFVGSVYAEDEDQTSDFNRISFSIIDGSFGSFIIRSFAEVHGYGGNITVDPDIQLDYESERNKFKLRVEATDLEEKKATVEVDVEVLDVNDERPEFQPIKPVSVKENTSISDALGSFKGKDKDGNHSLVYEMESIKCRCNGSLTPCEWFILDPTGEVRVNPKHKLDYEKCNQAVIEAVVIDEYTEKGENSSVETGQMVINIEDINDNAPEFIPSDSVFVVVSETASKGTSVAQVTATDRDSGTNSEIEFKVTNVSFVNNNATEPQKILMFEAITTQQKDIFVGIIQTTVALDMTLKGKYLVTVTATDPGGLSSSTVLEIFTVDETYKVKLQFSKTVEQVESELSTIVWALTAATKASVEVVQIEEVKRASAMTVMVVYFVFSNGTALTPSEVEKMVSQEDHYAGLLDLGLIIIGAAPTVEKETNYLQFGLLGLVGGLIVVLAVLTTSLLCTRRNFKRKLKAAKAMNSASMVTSDNQKSGPVVPGTNKYTMEGANPVLNLNIEAPMIPWSPSDESSDGDRASLNSLDYADDTAGQEKINPMMQMIEEEEEEDSKPTQYIEPLGAALAQRGTKKDTLCVGFNNPAFSTTDL